MFQHPLGSYEEKSPKNLHWLLEIIFNATSSENWIASQLSKNYDS